MVQLSVCIEPFFSHLDYEKRIEKIQSLGFKTYEFWFHNLRFDGKGLVEEEKDFDRIAELNDKFGLNTASFVFNHPDGGIVASLIDKKDRNRLLESIEGMISLAKKINCRKFITASGNKIKDLHAGEAKENMIEALSELAKVCERESVTLLLEPFNTKVDHPDYFLDDPFLCLEVIKRVNSANLKMLYDIYHMQIMTGNITAFIRENIRYIGHFHAAGVPGRHEPIENELNYRFIVEEIDKIGYDGFIGLEYWPTMEHGESLRRTREHLGS